MLEKAFQLIFEIDERGYSLLTTPLKRYFLDSLVDNQFPLTRVDYFTKLVYSTYFYFQEILSAQARPGSFYVIPFPNSGYYYLAHVQFTRIGNVWRTSEYGSGYTSTAHCVADWLSEIVKKFTFRQSYGDTFHSLSLSTATGSLFGYRVLIEHTWREHENGTCGSYSFKFASNQGAVSFGKFLQQKYEESKQIPRDQLLFYLRTYNEDLFYWNSFYLLDPKFAVLSSFLPNWLRSCGVDYETFITARNECIKVALDQLKRIARPAYEAACAARSPHDFNSPRDFFHYLRDVQYSVLSYKVIFPVLEECVSSILSRLYIGK
jgi:hypothetical protein